jgi:hypothetical protein
MYKKKKMQFDLDLSVRQWQSRQQYQNKQLGNIVCPQVEISSNVLHALLRYVQHPLHRLGTICVNKFVRSIILYKTSVCTCLSYVRDKRYQTNLMKGSV